MQSKISTKESPAKLIQYLSTYKKTSDTVFLIGGGPSVKTILPNPEVLYNHDVICCNNAYKLFPNPILTHFADKCWYDWHLKPKHDIQNSYNGILTTATNSQRSLWKNTNVICFEKDVRNKGLSKEPNKLNGGNCGHQAINIAVHMKYEQIVLIGFDLNLVPSGKVHWHEDHERVTSQENYKYMIAGFNSIEQSEEYTIYNLNPKSAIRCFPFANLQDFI